MVFWQLLYYQVDTRFSILFGVLEEAQLIGNLKGRKKTAENDKNDKEV